MTKREKILGVLRREHSQFVPFEFSLCPALFKEFKKRTGMDNYQDFYQFPLRYIELNPTQKKSDYTVYYEKLPPNVSPLHWNPEWGVLGVEGSVAHFQHMLHPMKNFQHLDEIDQYPFPDFMEDYRWQGLEQQIQNIIQNDCIAVAFMQMTIFEVAWYLRGMDTLLMDMIINPDFAEHLFDKITEIRIEMAKRYVKKGADILMLGDDIASQNAMIMDPELWRRTLKPRLTKIIDEARKYKNDILIFYHTDGNPDKIIPDLIEIGVDILNPVQPECIDPVRLKKEYGNELSFWGTLGTQTIMPFGTKQEVKDMCRLMIEHVGQGGGLCLAPTHVLEPDVPWDNIEAFIEVINDFNSLS